MTENWVDIFMSKYNEELEKVPPVNIMIIGKTGVGKSTLVNNIFREKLAETGIGKPITQHIRKITKNGIPLTIYDTKGIELNSNVQEEVKNEIIDQIDKTFSSHNEKEYIHVIWYCINSSSNRIEDFELQWVKEFSKRIPVIIVLTQCVGLKYKEFESFISNLNLPVENIVSTLAEEIIISDEITIPPFGLEKLVDVTYGILGDAQKMAFINAQIVDLDRKVNAARAAVITYVTVNFITGFTPIPFSDAIVLVPSQMGMLAHLTVIFGVNIEKTLATSIITAVGGVGGATLLGKTIVANALKFIPGIGTFAGGVISGTTAAILTAALGYAYIEVMKMIAINLYEGKTTSDSEVVEMMKKAYEEQMKKGKKLLEGINLN